MIFVHAEVSKNLRNVVVKTKMTITFTQYKKDALLKQLTKPEIVGEEIKSHFNLMESPEDVMWIAGFIVFVFGERLGKWEEGSDLLRKLKNNAAVSDKAQMKRLTAMLNLGNNPNLELDGFSDEDKFIILAATARSLASLGAVKNAQRLLNEAINLNSSDYSSDIQRAHVKLGLNYLKNKKLEEARLQADAALDMINNNGSQDENLDLFDAYSILAQVNLAQKHTMGIASSLNGMRVAFDKLDSHLQELNQSKLDSIESQK